MCVRSSVGHWVYGWKRRRNCKVPDQTAVTAVSRSYNYVVWPKGQADHRIPFIEDRAYCLPAPALVIATQGALAMANDWSDTITLM
jgi:hypothetical protein